MFTLRLTQQHINILGNALGARPYAEVAEVMAVINRQLIAQQQPQSADQPTVNGAPAP